MPVGTRRSFLMKQYEDKKISLDFVSNRTVIIAVSNNKLHFFLFKYLTEL
jgi:hypothetical protein